MPAGAAAGQGGGGATDGARASLVAAINDAFVVAALICAVGIVTSLVRGPGARMAAAGDRLVGGSAEPAASGPVL